MATKNYETLGLKERTEYRLAGLEGVTDAVFNGYTPKGRGARFLVIRGRVERIGTDISLSVSKLELEKDLVRYNGGRA